MSEIKNNATIHEEKVDINRSAIEHRSIWMGLTYEAGKAAGADAEAFARKGVSETGCLHGKNFKKICGEGCSMKTFQEAFLPELTQKTFEMDIKTCDESGLEIDFHYCPLVAGWMKAGIPKEDIPVLCDIAMDGDRNIAKQMGLEFQLGKTIAAGDDICEVCFYKKK